MAPHLPSPSKTYVAHLSRHIHPQAESLRLRHHPLRLLRLLPVNSWCGHCHARMDGDDVRCFTRDRFGAGAALSHDVDDT
jgi:hypothetical protein